MNENVISNRAESKTESFANKDTVQATFDPIELLKQAPEKPSGGAFPQPNELAFANEGGKAPKPGEVQKELQKTEEKAAKEDAKKFLKALGEDIPAGKWSETSKDGFKKLVNDFEKHNPNASTQDLAEHLNKIGSLINKQFKNTDKDNQVGMALSKDPDGTERIHMLINGPKTREANKNALIQGKEINSIIKVVERKSK